ncbi:hypothetical protein [Paraflavitalea speifideaquila]|uniref:hypothetical protein n=1 Tax=Paraflavitalea speifideaquila TaxID=3076558 RepID=UPI0028F15885|nr:hypothetical protein [Paraflavitalea speifideiaquila]
MTSMLALQYQFAVSHKPFIQFMARGEWQYLGEQYFDLANKIRQSPYNLLNTRTGISTKKCGPAFLGPQYW